MFKEPYELCEDDLRFIEGDCPDWVRKNYKDGDTILCIIDYNVGCFGSGLTHCFLKRGDLFCDIRGETKDLGKFLEPFKMYEKNRELEITNNLSDFNSLIIKYEDLREKTSNY